MNIGIKYCGGCNPRYERRQFLNRLQKELNDGYSFELAKENMLYDIILVLGGCNNCCADYSGFKHQYGVLCVRNDADYEKIIGSIKNICKSKY